MASLSPEQLREVLAKHQAWLRSEPNGQRADLQRANLQGANLQGADLQGANLQGANLQGANLQRAHLQGAYLQGADLQRADLQRANLQGANLQRADLQGAYLQGAVLHENWQIENYRDLLWIGPLGSRNDFLLANLRQGRVIAGCFEGTLTEFAARAHETHGDSEYTREYQATVDYLRALIAVRHPERQDSGSPGWETAEDAKAVPA